MAFDRSKFRATPLSEVKETVSNSKQYDTYFGNRGDRASFFKNEDGSVIKRVLPAHEPGDSPYVPMLTAQLECQVDDKDKDGNVIGKKIARKKIFLATLHGGYPYDIIEEYIKRVYEQAESIQDKEERSKFLNPITGYRMGGKNGKWVFGIKPQLEYVFYAYINKTIYRDSLTKKQMEALNRISEELCAQNDTAAVDMFSDPTEGFPILWTQGKDENNKRVVDIKPLPLKRNQTWDEFFEEHAIPDKVLEAFEEQPSLKKLYVDSYRKRDFDLALDGLKRFDEANVYNIFAQEDYLDMIEQLSNEVEAKEGTRADEGDADDLPFEEKPDETPKTKANPAPKAMPKKAAISKKKSEPTPKEMLKVVNEEFIRQYGDEYQELELEGEELEEAYKLAIVREDLGYDIPHVPGWDKKEEPEKKAVKAPRKAVTKVEAPKEVEEETGEEEQPDEEEEKEETAAPRGINPPSDAGSKSGQSAIDRIRALRNKKK